MSVREHGVIFSGWSVVAIGKGLKTQTRRLDRGRKPYQVSDLAPHGGWGPRIVVSLGGVEHSLSLREATDLERAISDALLKAAATHGQIDPRISRRDDEDD